MNNEVVFAAAGNGKTYSICKQAKEHSADNNRCVLLISYTNEGVHALENEYKKQNQGVLDNHVVIKTWYSFLLSELIKPYQCLLNLKVKYFKKEKAVLIPENYISSIAFYEKDLPPKYYNKAHVQYYLYNNGDTVPDRTSQLAWLCNEHSTGKALSRLESIYSHVFFDELQDYAGWDLEIIKLLFSSKVNVTCVGDYKQATYRTNNSQKNSQYRDEKICDFFKRLAKKDLCNITYENTTRRFNQQICDFVNKIHKDENAMVSPAPMAQAPTQEDNVGVYIIDIKYLADYCAHYNPVILRYDKRTEIAFGHSCNVFNYGGSKGATYERTIIIPVGTVVPFIKNQTLISSNQTRAKFYVACTRAKYSIVIAMRNPTESMNFKTQSMTIGSKTISVLKFSVENQ